MEKANSKETILQTTSSIEEAVQFIDSLSVKGSETVPNDARGIEALIDEKYSE